MLDRLMRIIRLDTQVFREIAVDANATAQAAIIVGVVSVLSGIGSGIAGDNFFGGLIWGVVEGFVFWVLWSVITFFVGASLFQGKSTIEEMLRVIGYASAPRLLEFFGFIPCVGWVISLAGSVLALIAAIIAVREAMEFDTGKAILTALVGWVVYIVLRVIFAPLFGVGWLLTR